MYTRPSDTTTPRNLLKPMASPLSASSRLNAPVVRKRREGKGSTGSESQSRQVSQNYISKNEIILNTDIRLEHARVLLLTKSRLPPLLKKVFTPAAWEDLYVLWDRILTPRRLLAEKVLQVSLV
jgi:hypothetical protein